MNLRDALQQHYDAHGSLVPADLVAAAAAADHPLHTRFEWDDSEAGRLYRLAQAGALIRAVKIRYAEEPEVRSTRAYLPQRLASGATSYEPVRKVAADPVAREVLLQQMRRDWQAFRRRYEHLEEFAALIAGAAEVPAA